MKVALRELVRSDLKILNRWRSDESTIASLGSAFRHIGAETDERWFENYLANRANNIRLAICIPGQDEPVGVVYLLGIDWIVRSGEFAIMIGDSGSRRKGVGADALRQLVRHAFDDLNLHRLHLTVLESNAGAIALYRNAGFVEEGRLRDAAFKQGKYHDLLQMSLVKDEHEADMRPKSQ